ncbi:MAG: NUDIX hydrolase [Chthoniobacterales bacterium]
MKFSSVGEEREGWETLASEPHFHDPHLAVATVEVRSPACSRARSWTVVHRKAAVAIAPMTSDGKLVLIRQERIAVLSTLWEVPAGQIDRSGQLELAAIEAVALSELREETGYELSPSGHLVPLGDFFSSPGFTDERGYCFLARNVEPGANGHAHELSESILDCHAFTPREIAGMIARNEIRDANTLSVCAKLVAHGFLTLLP